MHRKKGPRRPEGGSARVRECLPLRFSGSISVATVLVIMVVMVTVLMLMPMIAMLMLVVVMVAMLMLMPMIAITIKSHGAMPSRGHVSPF